MMMSIAMISSISAQRHGSGFHRGSVLYVPRVSVGYGGGFGNGIGLGYGVGYPYFGYPFYGVNPYGYKAPKQSKLTNEIENLKSDYADKIYSARNATDLDGKQRRAEVRQLKQERDNTINNLRNNYYKTPVQDPSQNMNPNNPNTNNSTPKAQY